MDGIALPDEGARARRAACGRERRSDRRHPVLAAGEFTSRLVARPPTDKSSPRLRVP